MRPETKFARWAEEADVFLKTLPYAQQEPRSLFGPMHYFIEMGGKRIRPVMALAAHAFSGGKESEMLSRACGIELFHNFTLIHDDVMDEAPVRRGKATVHQVWDLNTAILSGDLLMIEAYNLLFRGNPATARLCFERFNQAAAEVCIGQAMDMDFAKRETVTAEEYLQMIRYKTAVLLGTAIEIGGISAEADPDACAAMYAFGCTAGTAFQVWDDWLDCFGKAGETGKQTGGDILEKKKTLLVIRFLENASESDKKIFFRAFEQGDVEQVLELFHHAGIPEKIRNEVMAWRNEALDLLPKTGLSTEGYEFFSWLTDFFIARAY